MLHHSLGGAVIFISLEHFIAPALDLIPCFKAQGTRIAIRAFNPRSEQLITAMKQKCLTQYKFEVYTAKLMSQAESSYKLLLKLKRLFDDPNIFKDF